MNVDEFVFHFERLAGEVEQTVRGKPEKIRLALGCLLAGGHLLIEDRPGVGKTTLAQALAGAIGGRMKRIQFTPDLLPTDITGTDVLNQEADRLEFRFGPVFANVVLADEINRASPKTQSALLEVMQERRVTAGTTTRNVLTNPDRPDDPIDPDQSFMVLATQNPLDADGTYALPAAQLDRFLMRISLGYPDLDQELAVLMSDGQPRPEWNGEVGSPGAPVVRTEQVAKMKWLAKQITVTEFAYRYALEIVAETRKAAEGPEPSLRLGASPRGSLGLIRAARVLAASAGRDRVEPDDIKQLAPAVLTHRLMPSWSSGTAPETVLDGILRSVSPTPSPTRFLEGQ